MTYKYKIWHIDAYRGCSDYDGPCDCNKHLDLIMDASLSKKDVVDSWVALNSDAPSVAVAKCEEIGSGEIEV